MKARESSAAPAGPPAPWRGSGGAWIAAYLLLVAFPLVVLRWGELPRGGGFAWDFAMAIGFGGLAMMGLQFVLTARFRRATAPFGVDIIYYFHRFAALGAFLLLVGHYAILRVRYAAAIGPLNPLEAPVHLTAGRVSLLLFAILIVSSLGRRRLRLEYDRWRILHAVLAVAAVVLAMVHIEGIGHYTRAAGRGWVWTGYTVVWLLVLGYVRVLRPWSLLRRPYRVERIQPERGQAWTLTLRPDGHAGWRFSPGQFAWLTLRANPFQAREHPFSFSGSAAEAGTLQFTIKALGDFTRTIGSIQAGERAYVDGPHGIFTPRRHPDAAGFVLIAGGVGIAPLMSMLRTFADERETRPVRLVYGNWRWDGVLFREELDALRPRLRLDVVHVLQETPPGWTGLSGVLSADVLRAALPPTVLGHVFFLCGPKPMTDAVQRTLRELGVPLRRTHTERFDMA